MRRIAATRANDRVFGLAEGPVWDAERERLLWVDINAGTVHVGILSGHAVEVVASLTIDETVGAVAPAPDGDLLVAGRHALHRVDANGERLASWPVLSSVPTSRLNDGSCDPAGRFLVGSLSLPRRPGEEVLVRLEQSGGIAPMDDDLSLSNGLAWSPDGGTLYSVDTLPGVVWRRGYDADTGAFGERSRLLHISDGGPDGLAVDVDGNLWLAVFGTGQVRCYTPGGEVVAIVDLPAPHTTCVAFVGPARDLLLITTARDELTPEQLADAPESGRLFVADPGVAGVPVAPWQPTPAPPSTGPPNPTPTPTPTPTRTRS